METWLLYLLGVLIALLAGGGAGYIIVVYMNIFPKHHGFKERIMEIDKKLVEMEENPLELLEAEIEHMNERIERLEKALLGQQGNPKS